MFALRSDIRGIRFLYSHWMKTTVGEYSYRPLYKLPRLWWWWWWLWWCRWWWCHHSGIIVCSFEHLICILQSPSVSLCTLKPARLLTWNIKFSYIKTISYFLLSVLPLAKWKYKLSLSSQVIHCCILQSYLCLYFIFRLST